MLQKGSSLVIIGLTILCAFAVAHAQTADTPVVISATRVPVLGGIVHIYGHGFGDDASVISVEIEDPSSDSGATIPCTDVEMVTPNRVIGCNVATTGTGRSMHISVSIRTTDENGEIETVTNDDNNVAFSRAVPKLDGLVYSVADKTIVVQGSNFGFDVSKVSVLLAGDDYPVLAVDNNEITLRFLRKRRQEGYIVPDTSLARVTVDSQTNAANMTTSLAALVSETSEAAAGTPAQSSHGTSKGALAGAIIGGVFLLAVVAVVVAVFTMRRNKKSGSPKKELPPSSPLKKGPFVETGRIHHETGRALNFALTAQQPTEDTAADPEMQMTPNSPAIMQMQDAPVSHEDATPEINAGAAVMDDAYHSDAEHHSLEEIDLGENIYEKNDPRMDDDDSSFSESSDDDEDEHEDSTLDDNFSDASSPQSPAGEKRQQLQMSSEFPAPSPSARLPSTRIQQSPSPPMLFSTREALPPSSLRQSMIPLDLDYADSDGSPLPAPRNPKNRKAQEEKKANKKGMIRVPSSRLASRVSLSKGTQNVFDSPQL